VGIGALTESCFRLNDRQPVCHADQNARRFLNLQSILRRVFGFPFAVFAVYTTIGIPMCDLKRISGIPAVEAKGHFGLGSTILDEIFSKKTNGGVR
jgi:hypothetical protein